ncbi:MAG: 16S rRNA (uracil(1498)-N(3))-methyltransferase [Lachnospiraceae bacterium]|nr:16S rRNA (uracil(1498)-N(3))-methyltransferase [Lachnospiraceae bacterium]
MNQFFVEESQIQGSEIVIEGTDVNHIKNVLRMKPGEEIMVSNGTDKHYICSILTISGEQVVAKIVDIDTNSTELPVKLYLFQGLPKADKMELIIQKSVELGVSEIIPVAMKRCVVKLDGKKEKSKLTRWQGIAESAAKQSKRMVIPNISGVMNFKEAVAYAKTLDYNIIPYEFANGMEKSKQVVKEIGQYKSVGIFIGPEGGFDEAEIAYAKENNMQIISLGKRILRTETAGLTALSIIMFELEQDG